MNKKFDTKNYEFNKNSKNGVLIIHGFSSTTYEVKELAQFLGINGYHSVAKNLPGHGTTVENCNKIRFQDWLYFIKEEIAKLASQSENIYIVGCSMGAVLALYGASSFPLNGCVVGGTVFDFNNPLTIKYLIPLFAHILKTRNKKSMQPKNKRNEVKFYGYDEYPLIALNEMRKLNNFVKKKLPKVTCPSLIIHSHADKMSVVKNVQIVYDSIKSEKKEKKFFNKAHHNLFDANPDQQLIFNKILSFLKNN